MSAALTELQRFSMRVMEVLCYPQYLTIKSLLYFLEDGGGDVINCPVLQRNRKSSQRMSEKKKKWGMKLLQPQITLQPAIGRIMRENLLLICALVRLPLEVTSVRCMCQILKMRQKVCVSGVW